MCRLPALSHAIKEWKIIRESFKGRRISFPAASQFVFAGYSGAPFSNRAFYLRLREACRVGQFENHFWILFKSFSTPLFFLGAVPRDSSGFWACDFLIGQWCFFELRGQSRQSADEAKRKSANVRIIMSCRSKFS
jgi:hypothetical protein